MSSLVVHPVTRQALEGYAKAPSQSLLLVGRAGAGKLSMAQRLAETTLGLEESKYAHYAYSLHVSPEEGKSIGIEAVRQLEQFLSLKVPSSGVYNRAIIIEDADKLTTEAQNALLKTLEEPPQGTIIILTASHEQSLLPTINSRVQSITVQRPDKQQLVQHFQQDFEDTDINKAYAISGGLPGLMQSLLGEEDHPLMRATETARTLLRQTTYERLLQVDQLAKDKQLTTDIAYIMQQMAHVSLQTANGQSAKKWQSILKASHAASEALRASAQPKLAQSVTWYN